MASTTTNQPFATPWGPPANQISAQVQGAAARRVNPEVDSPLRRMGFYCLLGTVFLYYTNLHERLSAHLGSDAHILYIFTVPALIGLILSGGLGRAFSGRAVRYWVLFVLWMVIATPFSWWRGGSVDTFVVFSRTNIPLMLLLAGLPMTWKECRTVLYTLGFSGVVNVFSSKIFSQSFGDRQGLESTVMGNPNDFAGHLLMVLPLVVFIALNPPRVMFLRSLLRVLCPAVVLYGAYLVLASGSRGGMLGLGVASLFAVTKTHGRLRIALLVALTISAGLVVPTLPKDVLARLLSFSSQYDITNEAAQSAALRKQLLIESVTATLKHPLFGVGPGQFGNFEGGAKKDSPGEHIAGWLGSHNSYAEISAENGVPGLLFYLAGTVSPFLLLLRLGKRVRGNPAYQELALACTCLTVAWVGFCLAIFFLNFGYFFYLPAFAGVACSLGWVLDRELAQSAPAATPALAQIGPASLRPIPVAAIPMRPGPATASPKPSPAPSNRFRFNRYR